MGIFANTYKGILENLLQSFCGHFSKHFTPKMLILIFLYSYILAETQRGWHCNPTYSAGQLGGLSWRPSKLAVVLA
jgi:hypothetical protein